MDAAIIAIGTEMLGIGRNDTNSLTITRTIERYGVTLKRKSIVADDREVIAAELRSVIAGHEVIIISGGLGPTADDLTKEVVSEVFALPLEVDEKIVGQIRERFRARGLEMPEVNQKQAMVFAGGGTLPNARGTAPGHHLVIAHEGKERHLWLFPGVPHELEGLLESALDPWLSSRASAVAQRRVIRVAGMAESHIEEKLQPYYATHGADDVTILAGGGEVQIHLLASGDDATQRLDTMTGEVQKLLGESVFSVNGESMEEVIGRLLIERNETVGTAESCTGGLLSSRITDVSGSSAYFLGGVISYTRDAKLFLLGVDPAVIDEHGEVSQQVAEQMARGAHRRFGSTYGIGITGIAGPTGGTADKPVGTVHIAVASPTETRHRKFLLSGSRSVIKRQSTQYALDMLRKMMR